MTTRTVTVRVNVHDLRDGGPLDSSTAWPGDYIIKAVIETGEPMYGMVGDNGKQMYVPERLVPAWLRTFAGEIER